VVDGGVHEQPYLVDRVAPGDSARRAARSRMPSMIQATAVPQKRSRSARPHSARRSFTRSGRVRTASRSWPSATPTSGWRTPTPASAGSARRRSAAARAHPAGHRRPGQHGQRRPRRRRDHDLAGQQRRCPIRDPCSAAADGVAGPGPRQVQLVRTELAGRVATRPQGRRG
jgi:hypothetical protein